MMLKKTAVSLALGLGLVASASAAVYDAFPNGTAIGTPFAADQEFNYIATVGAGSFSDVWKFSISEILYSVGAVDTLSLTLGRKTYDISSLEVKLYQGAYSASYDFVHTAALATLTTTKITDPVTLVAHLEAQGQGQYPAVGDYFYTVKGVADGNSGGKYQIGVFTTPVPEPETYAMLLAGLGLMGTIARRRSKAKAS